MHMTVYDLSQVTKSDLKIKDAGTGKVLCHRYNANEERHKDIGLLEVSAVWAELKVTDSGFGNYAYPYLCAYAHKHYDFDF